MLLAKTRLVSCVLSEVAEVEILDFFSRPRGSPEKFKARLYARSVGKASDFDSFTQVRPTEMLHKAGHYHFKGNAMQGVIVGGMCVHRLSLESWCVVLLNVLKSAEYDWSMVFTDFFYCVCEVTCGG